VPVIYYFSPIYSLIFGWGGDMSKNTADLPYTEIVERVQEIARSENNTLQKIRGVIQDVYTREIAVKFDWNFLYTSTSLTTTAEYTTGNATVTTGNNTVLFASASIDSSMTGRLMKFTGFAPVYSATFVNSTTMTIQPSFQGTTNISQGSFSIFQPIYQLPRDFDRFPKDGGIFRWIGSSKKPMKELTYQEYLDRYSSTPSTPEHIRLVGTDTSGRQLIEFISPPKTAENYGCDYIRQLSPLTETTAGLISSISNGATSVVGDSNTRFLEANSGDWFRCEFLGTGQDSQWYRIANIANNQNLTLQTAFASTAVTVANYTIAKAPEMPTKLHPSVLYGAVRAITLDQTDETAAFYQIKLAEVLSDGKRVYVSRTYGQDVELINEEYRYRR